MVCGFLLFADHQFVFDIRGWPAGPGGIPSACGEEIQQEAEAAGVSAHIQATAFVDYDSQPFMQALRRPHDYNLCMSRMSAA